LALENPSESAIFAGGEQNAHQLFKTAALDHSATHPVRIFFLHAWPPLAKCFGTCVQLW
jgi:hypothetical protein